MVTLGIPESAATLDILVRREQAVIQESVAHRVILVTRVLQEHQDIPGTPDILEHPEPAAILAIVDTQVIQEFLAIVDTQVSVDIPDTVVPLAIQAPVGYLVILG